MLELWYIRDNMFDNKTIINKYEADNIGHTNTIIQLI